jgi:ankyrin repeat protein
MALIQANLIRLAFFSREPNTPIHYAAMFGQLSVMKWYFANGLDLNCLNGSDESPFHFACRSGNLDLVEFLARQGLDLTLETRDGRTPLFYAFESSSVNVVHYLIENGCNLHHCDHSSNSLMHMAVESDSLELVTLLIRHRVSVTASNGQGKIPILMAAHRGNVALVQLLVASNADLFVQDHCSLLEYAVKLGSVRLCETLLARDVTIGIEAALKLAVLLGKLEFVPVLLDHSASIEVRADDDSSLLHIAVLTANRDAVQCCLANGCDVNALNNRFFRFAKGFLSFVHQTPLHIAAMTAPFQIVFDLTEDRAKANKEDVQGVTPLHLAALRGDLEIVKLLLANGGKVNAVDKMNVLYDVSDRYVIMR